MENISIFDILYEKYKIKKPIRLIELFAGYGSQALALKYLGANFEHYKISEWAVKSIQAYKDLHFENSNKDYAKDKADEEIIDWLDGKISLNYNEPIFKDKIKKLDYRKIYNNMMNTNNIGSIVKAKGKDLEIIDTDKYDYIMTYSFPCITNDSLILTENGYIEMKDVKVGMKVLTKGNTWEKVAKKFDNGVHQTCYLNGMGFENIHCTLNHKFYVRQMYRVGHKQIRKFTIPDFKEAKDITKNDYFGIPIIDIEKEYFTNDKDFWYLIGYYIGDGWLSKKSNDIILACNEKKLECLKTHLDKINIKYTFSFNSTCYHLRFSDKKIKEFIKNNIGTDCKEKHINYDILCLPKEQLQSFYQGYLESDGCVIGNKHQFSSINRQVIYSISCIINKLYHRPTCIYKVKVKKEKNICGRKVNQQDWYQLRFKTENSIQDKAFYENGYIWYPFKKMEIAKEENVYNMEIENDHSYIVQGCISKNCQDLSLAGKRAGMGKDSGTRSGLLWEVERLLKECENKPQILLMENVTQVHSDIQLFNSFIKDLEILGYKSYWQDLIATDFGIPQTRNRTFMISILGDYNYVFPKKTKLMLKLKDMLEDDIEEKYYLSDKMINYISKTGTENYHNANAKINLEIARPVTTDQNKRAGTTNYIGYDLPENFDLVSLKIPNATKKGYLEAHEGDGIDLESFGRKGRRGTVQKGKSQTIKTQDTLGVVVNLKRGYSVKVQKEKEDSENIDVIGNYSKSNYAQTSIVGKNGVAPTVTENHGQVTAIVEKEQNIERNNDTLKRELCNKLIQENLVEEGDIIKHSYTNQILSGNKKCVEKANECITLTTRADCIGVVVNDKIEVPKVIGGIGEKKSNGGTQYYQQDRIYSGDLALTLPANLPNGSYNYQMSNLRIRKLTPRECGRLMGVKDEDISKLAVSQSDSSLYHLFGDSIVVNVLMAIFKELL